MDVSKGKINRRDFLKYSGLAGAALALPAAPGCSRPNLRNVPAIDYRDETAFTNCTLIDVKTGKIHEKQTILSKGGRIVRIDSAIPVVPGMTVIDMKDRWVTPGLIDTHCHTTASPVFSFDLTDIFKHVAQQKRHYELCIESGVTTVRDVGSFPGALHGFIKDIETGHLKGPRVTYCNSILNIKGGHPEIDPSDINFFAKPAALFIGMLMTNFEDTEELKDVIQENAEGASFLKITVDNKSVFCRKKDIAVYSDEQLRHIFDFGQKRGLPVLAHCHRKWGFDRAIQYPLHSFEHMVSDAYLSDTDVERLVKKGIAVVPTMTVGQAYLMEEAWNELPHRYKDDRILTELKERNRYLQTEAFHHCNEDLHRKNLESLKYYQTIGRDKLWKNKKFLVNPDLYFGMVRYGSKNLQKMRDAGVLIGCGIDAGMPLSYFGGLYRELEIYDRLGFSGIEILQCATLNNARIAGLQDTTGALEPGKYTDLVAWDKNPLTDIAAFRSPALVVRDGKLLHSNTPLQIDHRAGRVG
ncbi:MAG: amidohydrolase family protein [Thermodesulfobacteriota bacterium]|nr:amidohydrolase family protein [Thermodesulfobacteriota bacterium]